MAASLAEPRLWLAAGAVLILNLPFGWWRERSRRLSPAWFAAIHLPILLGVGVRLLEGIDFRLATLPVFVVAFLAGQYAGAAASRRRRIVPDRP